MLTLPDNKPLNLDDKGHTCQQNVFTFSLEINPVFFWLPLILHCHSVSVGLYVSTVANNKPLNLDEKGDTCQQNVLTFSLEINPVFF